MFSPSLLIVTCQHIFKSVLLFQLNLLLEALYPLRRHHEANANNCLGVCVYRNLEFKMILVFAYLLRFPKPEDSRTKRHWRTITNLERDSICYSCQVDYIIQFA